MDICDPLHFKYVKTLLLLNNYLKNNFSNNSNDYAGGNTIAVIEHKYNCSKFLKRWRISISAFLPLKSITAYKVKRRSVRTALNVFTNNVKSMAKK